MSAAIGKPRLMGISRPRTSSVVAWSEMARFTRRDSRPSRSMAGTRPTVDTVTRRGENPRPRASVSVRSDATVAA